MNTHKHSPFWVVALLATMLVLTGCGGGSSSGGDSGADDMPMPDPAIAERENINTMIMKASTAVAGIDNDSTDSEVSAADMAVADVRAAIAAADNVPEAEIAAHTTTVNNLASQLDIAKTNRMTVMNKAMEGVGKALHKALAGTTASANDNALNNIAAPTLTSADLTVNAVAGAGSLPETGVGSDPDPVKLKAGDSVGMLDGWTGMDYALTSGTGASKVTNEARVYTNRGSPSSMSFVEKYGDADEYTASSRTYNVGDAADSNIKASAFPTAGVQTFTGAQDIPGTYDGASGRYKCAATATCMATFTSTGIQLSAAWTFVHDSGARVSTPDANYLYYGWWVSKDSDGGPTAASAFIGEVGDVDGTGDTPSGADLTGSATYKGNAAGKFAMSNPLDGTGNGGHFTADAMLTANFGAIAAENENGVTGTIDNFRLNDGAEDPGWSVALNRSSAWAADGAITGPTSDATVWSINGNKAPVSGAWSGKMHDEMPGNAPSGDGSNIPTTVTGTFYSEFSTIGRMVGAFGADKE